MCLWHHGCVGYRIATDWDTAFPAQVLSSLKISSLFKSES